MSVRVEIALDSGIVVAGTLTDESVAALREALVEDGSGRAQAGRWLTGAKAAADYMGCSEKRVYGRLHVIPHERDGGRLIFRTDDLDRHLREGR